MIISRDRLEPLQELLKWLDGAGYNRPIIVDNASTYPPLVEFFDRTQDIEILRLDHNLGHRAPWISEELSAMLPPNAPFVATDCDVIPDRDCPADVVERLAEILIGFADIDKVGLGLRIDDLPDHYALRDEVIAWESQFWEREIAPGVFDAAVDTTFALYRSITVPHGTARALRTGAPYVARHLSWYADTANPTDEQHYYREHAAPETSHWETDEASDHLRILLDRRSEEMAPPDLGAGADDPLVRAWSREPPPHDERTHTPWADPGWSAWNEMSPELEFCELAGALVRFMSPPLVVETGVGQGFLARRLSAHLSADQRLLSFESDPVIRAKLEGVQFFQSPNRSLGSYASPSADDMSRAVLTVLDSDIPLRVEELGLWAAIAPPGAVLLIHDAGNGHGPDTAHNAIRRKIQELGIAGAYLRNPRGGFLGVKT